MSGPLIAINAVALGVGGGLHYLEHLLAGLQEREGPERYVVYAVRGVAQGLRTDNLRFTVHEIPPMSTLRRLLWEQFTLARLAARAGAVILISTANVAPLHLPPQLSSVVVVQNMAPFLPLRHYRLWRNQVRFRLLRWLTLASVRRASRVVAVGADTLRVLGQHVPLPANKCATVYLGKGEAFRPLPPVAAAAQVAADFDLQGEYILYVSHIYEYKNVRELVQAFARLAPRFPALQLAIAGGFYDGPYIAQVKRMVTALGLAERVRWLGLVPGERLPALYSACRLFAFPSAVETNSIILIEAMACGCLVAASRASVMPEVCRDAALYFDPFDPADIAAVLERVLTLPAAAAAVMRRRAVERAGAFSWATMVDRTLAVLRELTGTVGESS